MIRIEIVSPDGTRGYDVRNVSFPDRLGGEISIEVSRGDNAGEGMVVPYEDFYEIIDKFYAENF